MSMKSLLVTAVAFGAVAASGSALAVGPDLSALTGAIDFGTVVTAILAVGGALALVYMAQKGIKMTLSMLRGG